MSSTLVLHTPVSPLTDIPEEIPADSLPSTLLLATAPLPVLGHARTAAAAAAAAATPPACTACCCCSALLAQNPACLLLLAMQALLPLPTLLLRDALCKHRMEKVFRVAALGKIGSGGLCWSIFTSVSLVTS